MTGLVIIEPVPAASTKDRSVHPGLIVQCAAVNYDTTKALDHHVAERVARNRVLLYVDPPLSPIAARANPALRRALRHPWLRWETAGRFWRVTPAVLPYPLRPGVREITQALVRRNLARAIHSLDLPVSAVVSAWSELDAFRTCPTAVHLWWVQDDYVAGAQLTGGSPSRVAAAERARAADADVVLAASPVLAQRWQARGASVEVLPNGADLGAYDPLARLDAAQDIGLARPIAIVIGQFNARVDPTLLEAVADRGVSLLLIGPNRGAAWLHSIASRPNVRWLGSREFGELPRYTQLADVGLVPYLDTEFNRASFPLKLLEYLAAGLPVVATDLPAVRWLEADPTLVQVAADPQNFADAVLRAMRADGPDVASACRALARRHSYEARASQLLSLIDGLASRSPRASLNATR